MNNDTDKAHDDVVPDMTVSGDGSMHNDNQPEATNEVQPPQSVMDVTPPPADPVISNQANPVSDAPVPEPSGDTESSDDDNRQVAPAPLTEEIITPTGADPIEAAPQALKQKTGKGLIIVISIILAMVLAAIAILVVLKTNSTTKTASQSKTTQTAQKSADTTAVSATDVDTASKELDTTLSTLDDTKDFSADGLTDAALGLQ